MQNNKGWIKVHRRLQDCPIWYGERYSKGQAWIDLLLSANHRDKELLFNGRIITIKRGQLLTSMMKLAEKWGWNRKTVKSYLTMLETEHMIACDTDNRKTLVTIENYDIYQCDDETTDNRTDYSTDTKKDNRTDSRTDTNKNVKNVKNNNIYSLHSIVDEWNTLSTYGIKPVSRLTAGTKRYDSLAARVNQYGFYDVMKAIDNIRHSDFLQGKCKGNRQWVITFDWFVLPNNFPKVLEGQYNNPVSNNSVKQVSNDSQLEQQLENVLNYVPDGGYVSLEEMDRMLGKGNTNG